MKNVHSRKLKLPFMYSALVAGLLISSSASAWWWNTGYTKTKYPIVMAHGMLGFDNVGPLDYFYGITDTLEDDGADVYVAHMSALGDQTLRGEQLLARVEEVLAITGAEKVNLIGHSQGGLEVRYVAAVAPELVASVTSVGTPHKGTPVADLIASLTELPVVGEALESGVSEAVNLVGMIIGVAAGDLLPQDSLGSLSILNTQGAAQFNQLFPGGIPETPCGEGDYVSNNIRYYSWVGTGASQLGITNPLDPMSYPLKASAFLFDEPNDGLVGQCSSHLGKVIRDNYRMDHFDEVNQALGLVSILDTNPKTVFRQHANRLKNAGL